MLISWDYQQPTGIELEGTNSTYGILVHVVNYKYCTNDRPSSIVSSHGTNDIQLNMIAGTRFIILPL